MRKTTTMERWVETRTQWRKWLKFMSAALLATLLGIGTNWMAQEVVPQDSLQTHTEVVKKPWIAVHGMLGLSTNWIAADNAQLCSTNPSLTGVLSMSDPKTGFGVTAIRLDDFRQDEMSQPTSRATVLNPNWKKKFWEDKQFWIGVDGKVTLFDKTDLKIYTTDIVGSYSTKTWWTFEWMYIHNFTSWSDSFRASVSKQLDEAVKVVAQWWYEAGMDKKIYGRVMVDVKLKEWVTAEVSLIAKDGQLIPTGCLFYAF